MATAPARFLAEVPKPTDIETEVLDSFEARRKLREAINNQELKRKEAELELARTFAKETRNVAIDVEAAFQKYETWRVADERAAQRIGALVVLRTKVDQLIAKRKTENKEEVKAALRKRILELQKALEEKTEAQSDLEEEKALLEEEIDRLTKLANNGDATQIAAKRSQKGPAKKKRAAKKGAARK
jgi:hypothetical protein